MGLAKLARADVLPTLHLSSNPTLRGVYGVGVSISQIGKEKNKSNVGAIPFSSSRIASMFSYV
ncbi:hypothetical protein Pyn_02036 [Prunus yedoensis var. nudiflora]|uniref:Uncharacterized protein n=1 Tax=Prunus yedoensis var. nudiflora TaxID=2094558 RepID=A0A314UX19_PRUYE|nr:hypothetical protein Pyn_02036 [Prunus yedoensis var. nudiflora]